MGESYVNVTEGSGKKLHSWQRTIGANAVEDQVILHGEPYLPGYIFNQQTASISTATSSSHLLEVMAGSSLNVRVRRIEIYQTAAATTAALLPISVIRLSTAGTGGTSYPSEKLNASDAASGATSMTLPTVKGTAVTTMWQGSAYMMQTIAASAQLAQPILAIDFDQMRLGPLVIAAGTANGIAIKNLAACAAATVMINVWVSESSF